MKKLSSVIILIGIISIVLFTGCGAESTQSDSGDYTQNEIQEIAKCMTEKGVIMYGSISCPHCTDQKARFGDAVQFINYVECNAFENKKDAELCVEKGIEALPTWDLPNGDRILGNYPISELAEKTGC